MANRSKRARTQGRGTTAVADRSPQGARMTKSQRKEEARRQREELLRRKERARRFRVLTYVTLFSAALAVVVYLVIKPKEPSTPASSTLPGMLTTPAPWPANTADLSARLNKLSLPPEGGAMHVHSSLAISVDGKPVPVPADIGVSASAGSPLHTHDASGVIHVESADPGARFTLGQFFDVWGVRLTDSCIGGYCASGDRTLRVFVNGKPVSGDPRAISLDPNERDIVIAFGTKAQVPDPLPTFDWSHFTA